MLDYAPPPKKPLPTIGQYIWASLRALAMFMITMLIIASFFGQTLKEIGGWQQIWAALAIYAIPTGVAISSFRASIKGGPRL